MHAGQRYNLPLKHPRIIQPVVDAPIKMSDALIVGFHWAM
jgi:hypothetical protein